MPFFSEAPQVFFQRFYSGWITLRNQLVTPIRVFGRRLVTLYDALLVGNDMEITPNLTLARRPGYVNYFSGAMNGTLLNTYSWKSASRGIYQIFDTTADVEAIAPGASSPTVIFTKPGGSVGNKSYMIGVGNYLFVSGVGFAFKWDGSAATNWGITIGSLNNATGPNYIGTGSNVTVGGSSSSWANPTNAQGAPNASVASTTIPNGGGSASTAVTYCTTATQSGSFGWSNLVRVTGAPDGSYATDNLGPLHTSAAIQAKTFGFSIPNGATITGIQATVVHGDMTGGGSLLDRHVQLVIAGTAVGSDLASVSGWGAPPETFTYGGSSNLWGLTTATLTPAAVNASNFGLQISVQNQDTTINDTAGIDAISLKIFYNLPGGTKYSDNLQGVAYGFALSGGNTISGIKLVITGSQTQTAGDTINVQLLKAGVAVGQVKSATLPASNNPITLGGTGDLWGTTWTVNDINSGTFGVLIQGINASNVANATFNVDAAGITVYGTGGPSVSLVAGSLTAVNGFAYVQAFGSSTSGEISNATPASSIAKPSGQGVQVTVTASTDAQVNQIHVYRTTDSGGGSVFYELPNSPVANSNGTVVDNAVDTSLQITSIAATSLQNTPPPTNMTAMEWFAGRMWGVVGGQLYFSTGPDSISGLQQSNWNPSYVFVIPTSMSRLIATPNGMLAHTLDDIKIVRGISTTSFTVNDFMKDIGLWNYNAADTDGSNIYIYTADRQFIAITANGIEEVGGGVIADQLHNVDPSNAYVTCFRAGLDSMLFLYDPTSGILYPYNTRQQAWCLPAILKFTGTACGAMETQIGVWKFLIGTSASIAQRDLGTFTDLGTNYIPQVVIGSIQLADPGTLVKMENLFLELTNAGTIPTVSVLVNDAGVTLANAIGSQVTGTFTALINPQTDPPTYGTQPVNYQSLRYNWASSNVPAAVKHVQILIQFIAESTQNEILGFGLSGKTGGDTPGQGQVPQLMGH